MVLTTMVVMHLGRRRVRLDQLASCVLLCVAILSYGSIRLEERQASAQQLPQTVYQIPTALIPVRTTAEDPIISASSAAVIDVASGTPLYSKHARDVYLPASTTKLMTALVVRQSMDVQDLVTATNTGSIDGSKIGFAPGLQFTVHTLLKAMLIQSANDAAELLAQHFAGGRQAFVAQMNHEAQRLHLQQTIFENPTGFDGIHHQTSAFDLALLAKEVVRDPVLREIVGTRFEHITDVARRNQYFLTNTHALVGVDPTVTGVKTGTTDGAGQVLITQVERNGQKLIVVVMGSGDRYEDTKKLMDWAYASYRWQTPQDLTAKHVILENNE